MKILITGGAGTLGRALIAHFSQNANNMITVLSRDPMKHMALRRDYPGVICVPGDIRDYATVYQVAAGHDIIIHAAAQKHIPVGEAYPEDTIGINVQGSINVCAAAVAAGVPVVVGISTDKVCYPINTYGATKLLMERIFIDHASRYPGTKFTMCRYGNVVGSTGSVLQVWRRQIEEGHSITITDPDMTRFWISENDAVNLVQLAMTAASGDIVIPMARAMSMGEMARAFAPHAPIDIIGQRPGEKYHECLLTDQEAHRTYPLGNDFITLHPEPVHGTPALSGGYYSNQPRERLTGDALLDMIYGERP